MRLPQSIAGYLSVRVFRTFLTCAAVLMVLVPTSLQAATGTLAFSPSSLRFGQVAVGQTETQLITLTNNTQNGIAISTIGVSNSEFSVSSVAMPIDLAPGQSVDVSVAFAPTTTGWAGGKVSFVTSANTVSLQVGGTGVTSQALTANPTSISFGQVAVGTSTTAALVLTNIRTWNVKLTGLQTQDPVFSVSAPSFPLTLGPGQSITLNVSFAPQVAGVAQGGVLVVGPGLNVPFSGTGTTPTAGQLTINPATLNFGNVTVGTTDLLATSLGASGGAVTISSAASNSAQYALQGTSFPLTIPAGQTVSVNIAFTPQSSGSESGSLTFASNATNSPATESLVGTGTASHSVDLTWDSSSGAVGYNVYRGTVSGGPYTIINSSLDTTTAYTDNTVVAGTTYYYVAAAVNASQNESGYSNQAQATIPSP